MASPSRIWLRIISRVASILLLASLFSTTPAAGQVDPALLAGMSARSIGPAGMSGRVAVVVAAPSDPTIVYVGAATGGVWKSVNGGLSFEPIFDDQPVASIGAIAVHPTDPDVVWVGTGEGNVRNSVSVGNGIYRSRDGGRTWEHLGLEATERIHRIIIHPRDPSTVWVAAMGREWGENPERGVYRTTDAGSTLGAGPVRRRANRSRRPGHRPQQSGQAVRGHVGIPAVALVLQVGRSRVRSPPHARRRRHLDTADARRRSPGRRSRPHRTGSRRL